MRCGPGSASARRSWSASSSAVVARVAGTPMPVASATKSRSGPPRSSSCPARLPSLAAPTRDSSCCEDRVRAVVADDRRDVGLLAGVASTAPRSCTSRCRRPGCRSPAGPGRRPPRRAPWAARRRSRRRSGHSQSCRGAPEVSSVSPTPEVSASSTTIALSGSSAPMTAAIVRGVSSPGRQLRARRLQQLGLASGAACSASAAQRGDAVLPRRAEHVHGAVLGHRVPGHAG